MSRSAIRRAAVLPALLAAALATAPQAVAHGTPAHSGTVRASAAQLDAADAAVREADVAGTAWYTDQARDTLVVMVDGTVSAADRARVQRAAETQAPADAVEVRRVPGQLAERIAGGDPITSPEGLRCTVGFNVRNSSGATFALTAGHCTSAATTWSIGPVVSSSFPGNDYGLIRYTDPSQAEGGVRGPGGSLIDIVDAADPSVGQEVCAAGNVTGIHCGEVIALNATVNTGQGTVSGLIQTSLCSEPGDSGGPLYSGHTAIGIISGGSGDCSSGGQTFYQPVTEPLQAYGVDVF